LSARNPWGGGRIWGLSRHAFLGEPLGPVVAEGLRERTAERGWTIRPRRTAALTCLLVARRPAPRLTEAQARAAWAFRGCAWNRTAGRSRCRGARSTSTCLAPD